MVRSSLLARAVLAVVGLVQPNAVFAGDVAQQVTGGSGIAPSDPSPSTGKPSASLVACAPDAEICGSQVPTTVTVYNGTSTRSRTRTHIATTNIVHTIESTTVIVSMIPTVADVVICPNETTTTLPIPSVVEAIVDYTRTETFIDTSTRVVSTITYITERAISACVKSTYNILAAAATTPSGTPSLQAAAATAAAVAGNSGVSSQAAAATAASVADEAVYIDVNDPDVGAIPEPASEPWDF